MIVTFFPPQRSVFPFPRVKVLKYNIFDQRLIISSWGGLRSILKSKRLHWHACISLQHRASSVLWHHGMVTRLWLAGMLGTNDHSRLLSWDSGNYHWILRKKERNCIEYDVHACRLIVVSIRLMFLTDSDPNHWASI